ncbi:hypothetical protein [Amycolatopsis sp. ATCC 39116]|uniref:hypothetical protein n=1 Tax=Amycolatopsis sp. (strain ATCC 39116 / 75iv2) TaxID=385957 RepID=UPI000262590F|nr:hypothetical protein [Amycolatopsis sp. ATCC 39116]
MTITDCFDVFGDATFVDAADRFDDALAEPVDRNREFNALLAPDAITIPPSDLPAWELPEYEPTVADLLAVEAWAAKELEDDDIDARIASANTLSAYEQRHRELMLLRANMPQPGESIPEDVELGRAA